MALTLAYQPPVVFSVATLPGWKLNFQSPVYPVRASCVEVVLFTDQVEPALAWLTKVSFVAYQVITIRVWLSFAGDAPGSL